MDYTVHRILQARILEWVAFPFCRGFSQPRDQTQVARIAGRFFTSWAIRELSSSGQLACCEKPGFYLEGWKPVLKSEMIYLSDTANLLLFFLYTQIRPVAYRPSKHGFLCSNFQPSSCYTCTFGLINLPICLLKNLTHERIKIYLVLPNTIMTKYITGKIWSSWDPGSSHRVFPFSWVLVRKLVDKDRWILKETSRAMLATHLNWEFPNYLLFILAQDGFPILSLALWVHKWRKDILLRWAVIWGPRVLPTRNPDRVWRKRWSDGRLRTAGRLSWKPGLQLWFDNFWISFWQ